MIPPLGGTTTQDLVDVRGRVIEKRQYVRVAVDRRDLRDQLRLRPAGRLTTVTDPASNPGPTSTTCWAAIPNHRPGRRHLHPAYDNAGQVTSTTDARGQNSSRVRPAGPQNQHADDRHRHGPGRLDLRHRRPRAAHPVRRGSAPDLHTPVTSYDDAYRPLHNDAAPMRPVGGIRPAPTGGNTPTGPTDPRHEPARLGRPARRNADLHLHRPGYARITPAPGRRVADLRRRPALPLRRAHHPPKPGQAGKQVRLTDSVRSGHPPAACPPPPSTAPPPPVSSSERSPTPTPTTKPATSPPSPTTNASPSKKSASPTTTCAASRRPGPKPDLRRDHPQRSGADPYWRTGPSTPSATAHPNRQEPAGGDTTWTSTVGTAGRSNPTRSKPSPPPGRWPAPTRNFSYDPAGNTLTRTHRRRPPKP